MPRTEESIELDQVLSEIGQFGPFQVWQYALMILPIMLNAFFTFSYVFTAGNMDYRCYVPECDLPDAAVYDATWTNLALPFDRSGHPERCHRFLPISDTTLNETCTAAAFNVSNLISCSSFVYRTGDVTIVRDFGINCAENDWKLALVGTMNNIGQFVALPIAGYLSDQFGRRWILLISVAGSALCGVIRSFSNSYAMFLVFEFLDPAIGSTMYTTAFILALELVGSKKRVTGNNIISCAFSFGEALLGLLAMYINNWRVLLRTLYFSGFLATAFLFTTTESVRWLLSKNRPSCALKILQKAAKVNGKTLSPTTIENLCPNSVSEATPSEPMKTQTFAQLLNEAFHSPGLTARVINCSFCWLTNTMVYFGLSLNSVSLSGNKYVNFILVSLIELPGFFLMQLFLDRTGRKRTLFVTMIISGLLCIISGLVPLEAPFVRLVLFLLSKLTITMSFGTLYIYTVEIFPTNLRQTLLSACSMIGRVGSMIAPQTPLLSKLWIPLPMFIFGCLGISSGVAILQLPETLNTELPDTVHDAMNMSKKLGDHQAST
ncbi:organic cation transporter protein-like isoform X1 [Anopheles darlingi]|uniref:organic cation transporter protein-like isoform X1 n=1 Tax=Anopheles darlingi TaxID=43151 RepID=UPI00210037F1|nr:organic cation transporter protein-like isoform X1 [Anopheles darlingi]